MPRVRFTSATGRQTQLVEGRAGESAMQAAVREGVPGIVGECKGELNCGTCHAHVDEAWTGRLPAARAEETELIEVLDAPRETSRLMCQVPMDETVDGLSVAVPDWDDSEPPPAPADGSQVTTADPSAESSADARYDVVIVGAGHGGAQLAAELSRRAPAMLVALVSAEEALPYDRPSLSKSYLLGETDLDGIQLRAADYWTSSGLEMVQGDEVTELDPQRQRIRTASGRSIQYGSLVWAAGGRARRLPDSLVSASYLTLRDLEDARLLKRVIESAHHITIIGGGYIGLEAAAVLRSRGIDVTVVEAQDRLLARVTGDVVSAHLLSAHRRAGVEFRLGCSLIRAEATGDGARSRVVLDDGTSLETDQIIVGIGMLPNIEVLERAGAEVNNGVVVDELCRTSLEHVYAIGDCAAHENRYAGGRRVRLECVQNAVDQAKVVEGVLLGEPAPYQAVPWFWSNQFDIRLKSAGLVADADRTIVRGEPDSGTFSVLYFQGERVVAIDAINAPGDYARVRQVLRDGLMLDTDLAADATKDLAKAVRTPEGTSASYSTTSA